MRDTLPRPADQAGGRGIAIEADGPTGVRSEATLVATVLQRNHDVGILVVGSDAVVDRVTVTGTLPRPVGGQMGRALQVQRSPNEAGEASVTLQASLFSDNHDVAVFLSASSLVASSTIVRGTGATAEGFMGDGIAVVHYDGPASGELVRLKVEQNARAGLGSFGAYVTVRDTTFSCNAFDLAEETFIGMPPELIDGGGNHCGCETESACHAVSAGLEAPEPLP
ncbi:MAG: hypothetical protein JRI68_34505 [Deltaproteobacteria bacterium]|nr:hypothetical protein [Deltaproteobacteria bacterium]